MFQEPFLSVSTGPAWGQRKADRRSHRMSMPACECGATRVSVRTRTDDALYLTCWDCGHVWSTPRPKLSEGLVLTFA